MIIVAPPARTGQTRVHIITTGSMIWLNFHFLFSMRKEIRTNFLSTKIAQIVRKSLVSVELSMMGAYSLRKKIINFSLRTKTSNFQCSYFLYFIFIFCHFVLTFIRNLLLNYKKSFPPQIYLRENQITLWLCKEWERKPIFYIEGAMQHGSTILVVHKVHILWESHKILQNLHLTFDWHYIL